LKKENESLQEENRNILSRLKREKEELQLEVSEERQSAERRDMEVSVLQKENGQLQEVVKRADEEREQLQKLVQDLQLRNRELNCKLSSSIFRAAEVYREKTEQSLSQPLTQRRDLEDLDKYLDPNTFGKDFEVAYSPEFSRQNEEDHTARAKSPLRASFRESKALNRS
jgi:hypothetical protein